MKLKIEANGFPYWWKEGKLYVQDDGNDVVCKKYEAHGTRKAFKARRNK